MANVEHLDVFAGESRTLPLAARDSANIPADLTDKTVAWYVGRSPWHPDCTSAIITKTGTVISAADGTFSVAIDPADTRYLNGDYEHMAKTTDASGNVAVVCRGRFRVQTSLQVT